MYSRIYMRDHQSPDLAWSDFTVSIIMSVEATMLAVRLETRETVKVQTIRASFRLRDRKFKNISKKGGYGIQ
jgi:hypothetical protein